MTPRSAHSWCAAFALLACNTASTSGAGGAPGGNGNGAGGSPDSAGAGSAARAAGGPGGASDNGGSNHAGAAGTRAAAAGASDSTGVGARAGAPGGAGSGDGAAGRATNGGADDAGGSGQAADGGTAGAGCDDGVTVANASCLPEEEPSTQTVYFDITNEQSGDVYVVASGKDCTAYGIQRSSASDDLVLEPFGPVDCPCGFACDSNTQSLLRKLGPGETLTLTWDARDLAIRLLKVPNACDPSQMVTETRTAPRRVGPGDYSVSIGYYLPPPCDYCGLQPTYAFSFQPQCAADEHVSATFTLPDTGDVRVPVQIGEALGN